MPSRNTSERDPDQLAFERQLDRERMLGPVASQPVPAATRGETVRRRPALVIVLRLVAVAGLTAEVVLLALLLAAVPLAGPWAYALLAGAVTGAAVAVILFAAATYLDDVHRFLGEAARS